MNVKLKSGSKQASKQASKQVGRIRSFFSNVGQYESERAVRPF